MLGRHHILITLLLLFPFIYSFFPNIHIALFLVFLGSIVPDVDAKESAFKHGGMFVSKKMKKLIRRFYVLLKYLFYYPYAFAVSFISKDALKHRRAMHSLFPAIFLTALFYIVLSYFNIGIYSFSFLLGYTFHLIEDSFTKSGVCFLYPFNFCLKGRLRTGSLTTSLICDVLVAIFSIPLIMFFKGLYFGILIFSHSVEYVVIATLIMAVLFLKY